jgi:hypothetical protein
MSEDLPGHLVQALVQTGNMVSEKEMNNTIRRIGRENIFPKQGAICGQLRLHRCEWKDLQDLCQGL